MTLESLLQLGGVMHLAIAFFHLTFWRLFRWRADLRSLTRVNRGIVQVLNLCLTLVFLFFAYLSLLHPGELLTTGVGRVMLWGIAGFWLLRAVQQPLFFPSRATASLVLIALFVLMSGLYGWAAAAGGERRAVAPQSQQVGERPDPGANADP